MVRKSLNGKIVLVVLFTFFMSTLMLPGFTTKVMAAEAAAGAGAAGSGGSSSSGGGAAAGAGAGSGAAGTGAAAAGAAAGAATAAGIGVGTIAAIAAAAAAVVAGVVSAASSTTTNTSAAATTPTYNCVLSNVYNEYICSTDSATTITHYLAIAHNTGMSLATAHSHFKGNLTNFAVSHTGKYPN